jgi:hypothetical protein
MNKRTVALILVALLMGGIYVLKFTDWFGQKSIQILFTNRDGKVFFGLDGKEYKLNRVKVFQTDDAATNKFPHPLWHLISTNQVGSEPIADFLYGDAIAGMKPDIAGMNPEQLRKNVSYKIVVESGKIRGEREFSIH